MRRLFALTVSAVCLLALTAAAKPPGLPTSPDTEFKVLPALALDFHQAEPGVTSDVFVPIMPESSALWSEKAIGGFRWGCGGYTGNGSAIELTVNRNQLIKLRLTQNAFRMAQEHMNAGEWSEAQRWYAGVMELCHRSPLGAPTRAQLDRLQVSPFLPAKWPTVGYEY